MCDLCVCKKVLADITAHFYMNGEDLEEISSFKHLGDALTNDERSLKHIKRRNVVATSSMAKRVKIWKSREISFLKES